MKTGVPPSATAPYPTLTYVWHARDATVPDKQVSLPVRVGWPCVEAIRMLFAPVAALLLQPPTRNATHGVTTRARKGEGGGTRVADGGMREGWEGQDARKEGTREAGMETKGWCSGNGCRAHAARVHAERRGRPPDDMQRAAGPRSAKGFFEHAVGTARRLPTVGGPERSARGRAARRLKCWGSTCKALPGCSRHAGDSFERNYINIIDL